MHGRTLRRIALGWSLLLLAGCSEPVPPSPEEPGPEAASLFRVADAGTITGRVTWAGPVPAVRPFHSRPRPLSGYLGGVIQPWANPHAPQIGADGGVANAIVFLRGVPPEKARPWDHAAVRVELANHQLYVRQGDVKRSFGFVRRGGSIEMTSAQNDFPSLQARGANFFARTFAEAEAICTQRLSRSGTVELMSGSGAYWARAHLFVDDHPYYTATRPDGRFTLEAVPAGEWEIVCWLPNWRVAERELDGDTGLVWRVTFAPPLTGRRSVRLGARQTQAVDFTLRAP